MSGKIAEHLEVMDHEISGYELSLSHQGYRVDGDNGIKIKVGMGNRRSVDYFHLLREKCRFVEFTDLARGQEDLLGIEDALAQIDNALQRNKLKKLLKRDMRDELATKFKDSKDIFLKLPEHYQDLPTAFVDYSAKTYYIVHAPINELLTAGQKAQIARFLLTLKARVSDALEDDICQRVKLMLLGDFAAELSDLTPT